MSFYLSYGFCWSVHHNPTTADNKIGNRIYTPYNIRTYSFEITGLRPSTTYYVRAFALNQWGGIGYGKEVAFTTQVVDIEGNVYNAIQIGTQTWMAENLRTMKYRNGDSIENVTDDNTWQDFLRPAYCSYQNSTNYANLFGNIYNWYAINDPRNIVPVGWHIPSDEDWDTLANYLGGESQAGGKMKAIGYYNPDPPDYESASPLKLWLSPNSGATNGSGFSALPGGMRGINNNPDDSPCYDPGEFNQIYTASFFWSTSPVDNINAKAWIRFLAHNNAVFHRQAKYMEGYYVRCIKD